jgi:hypothetical protein
MCEIEWRYWWDSNVRCAEITLTWHGTRSFVRRTPRTTDPRREEETWRLGAWLTSCAVPIARSFWENEEMGDLVLDGVVCVVDSRNVLKVGRNPVLLSWTLLLGCCFSGDFSRHLKTA